MSTTDRAADRVPGFTTDRAADLRPGFTTVRAAARVPMPIAQAWERFRDLTLAREYVPGLTDTVITTEAKEGVGASRIVRHRQFGDMNETVIEWQEGRGMTIRLHKGDGPARPFREAFFRYEFQTRDDPAACEIHTTMTYRLPWGWFGRILDRLFLRRVFRRNVVDTAVCLAENYRTLAPVAPERIPQLRRNAL
jgi:hypothetical protein